MAKKKEKPAPEKAAEATDAPKKKRSKLRLAIIAVLPLILAGGGYFGWTFFAGEAGEDTAHASEGTSEGEGHGDGHGAVDNTQVSAVPLPPEIAAEGTFTYSFALAELLNGKCGKMRMKALKVAVAEEAATDGTLVNLSWIAANRRIGTLTKKSCDYVAAEIEGANDKAHAKAEEKAAALKAAEGGGGGHDAPAAHH